MREHESRHELSLRAVRESLIRGVIPGREDAAGLLIIWHSHRSSARQGPETLRHRTA